MRRVTSAIRSGRAWAVAAVVLASALSACGDDDSEAPAEATEAEQTASPTSESEAVEQLGLKIKKVGDLNADFTLPGSDCVAEALFFGEDTVAQEEGGKGVVVAGSGDWGVRLTSDSDTPQCADEWQEAMG